MKESSVGTLLRSFGFTDMEASVYCHLLVQSPMTGYKVAKGVGKATANVYAAIETLRAKGAIVVDEGENRLCRAVPPDQLLGRLRQEFNQNCEHAEKELMSLYRPQLDNRIYQITDFDQVISHARKMIEEARETIVLDIFPVPLKHLESNLAEALKRGVKVAFRQYGTEIQIDGALAIASEKYDQQALQWPGEQLNIVADAKDTLLALFNRDCDEVIQAVVTQSHYLSNLMHSAIIAEIVMAHSSSIDLADDILDAIRGRSLLTAKPPGYREFLDLVDSGTSGRGHS